MSQKWVKIVSRVIVGLLVLTMLAVGNSALQKLLLDPWKLCLCTVITGGVLPLLVWLTAAVRGRRAEK